MSKLKINIKDKRLWFAVGIIIVLTVVFTQINRKDVSYIYTYEKVEKGKIEKTVSVSGTLDLHERVFIRSAIAGEITNIYTDYNEKITKDQLLLEIYSETIVESFENYSDEYRFKRIDLENARDLYLTKKQLYEEELISEREFSDARVAYQRMQSSFENVEKEYQRRKELLEGRKVYASESGTVINKAVVVNQSISAGTLLFEIAPTLDKMNLTINVDESDIGIVKKGQAVTFSVSAYPDETFTGTIRELRISPINVNGITMYESLVVCQNRDEKLKPGMSATATIHIGNKDNVLKVPNQAFMVMPPNADTEDDTVGVWVKKGVSVAKDQQVEKIPVEIGLRGDSYTEIITDTIKESDEVLVSVLKENK